MHFARHSSPGDETEWQYSIELSGSNIIAGPLGIAAAGTSVCDNLEPLCRAIGTLLDHAKFSLSGARQKQKREYSDENCNRN
jgi:hypothetical protein